MDRLPEPDITYLLRAWGDGQDGALDELIPMIQGELHRLARRYMQRERPGQTLQTTALVNEAYLRLMRTQDIRWCDRIHFFAVAARIMRRILIALARAKREAKRTRAESPISLDQVAIISERRALE